MEQGWHAYLGSNTAEGFFGYYNNLQAAAERAVIIKGGPGVGKSTLMKKVAAHYEEKGLTVHYYHCSGDPDSLDAVFVQENGFLMADGTSPHVLDPIRPGARDGILKIG
ncbi:MAG: ATPase, partial [Clostridia bacterium]|nr:ATPase [Clostridia bacterium]